jgi:hypothetical protein
MFGKTWGDAGKAHVPRSAPYDALFGKREGPSFRELHMVKDGKPDRRKYGMNKDPLAAEDDNPVMEYGPARERASAVKGLREYTKHIAGGGRRWAEKEEAKAEFDSLVNELDDKYVSDFTEWLRGAKDPETQAEHAKAGWNPGTIIGPISDHETVRDWLVGHNHRRQSYEKQLAEMKLRHGRMSAESRTGKGMTLNDAWRYYKYVVRNADPSVPDDVFAPAGPGGSGSDRWKVLANNAPQAPEKSPEQMAADAVKEVANVQVHVNAIDVPNQSPPASAPSNPAPDKQPTEEEKKAERRSARLAEKKRKVAEENKKREDENKEIEKENERKRKEHYDKTPPGVLSFPPAGTPTKKLLPEPGSDDEEDEDEDHDVPVGECARTPNSEMV